MKSLRDPEIYFYYFNFSTGRFSKSLHDSEICFNFSTGRFSKSLHDSEICFNFSSN